MGDLIPDSLEFLGLEGVYPFQSEPYNSHNNAAVCKTQGILNEENPIGWQNNTNQMDVEMANPIESGTNYEQPRHEVKIFLRESRGKPCGELFNYIIRKSQVFDEQAITSVPHRRVAWFIINTVVATLHINRIVKNSATIIYDSAKSEKKDLGPHFCNGHTLFKYTFGTPGQYSLQWLIDGAVLKQVFISVAKQTCSDDIPTKPAAQKEASLVVEAQLPANTNFVQPIASPPLPPAQIVNVLLIALNVDEAFQAQLQSVLQKSDFQKQLECNDKTELWKSEGFPRVNAVVAYQVKYTNKRHIHQCGKFVDEVLILIPNQFTFSVSQFISETNVVTNLYTNDNNAVPYDASQIPKEVLQAISKWQADSDAVKRVSAACVNFTEESLGEFIMEFIEDCIPTRQLNIYWCFKIKIESAVLITDAAKVAMNIIKTCLDNAIGVLQYEGSAYGCYAVFVSGSAITRWVIQQKKFEISTNMKEKGLTLTSIHEMNINDVERMMADEKNKPFLGKLFDLTQRMYNSGVPLIRPKKSAPSIESRNLIVNPQLETSLRNADVPGPLSIDTKISEEGAKDMPKSSKLDAVQRSLNLSSKKIGREGAKSIAESLKTNTVLTSLDLSYNKISNEGAKLLGDSLKTNTVLSSLNLLSNEIQDEGAISLADSLKSNNALTSLGLGTNEIQDEGAKSLADSLKSNNALTSFSLHFNQISEEGAKSIANSLKTNTVLTSLNLGMNNIRDEGAKAMAESLKTNTVLASLSLTLNKISDEGAISLGESLKLNTVLTSLNLKSNSICKEGAQLLAESLKTKATLTFLNLDQNKIQDEGAMSLADSLKTNTVLTSLNLGMNKISAKGATSVGESLKSNTVLTSLDFGWNEIGDEGAKSIAESIKTNTVLTSLDLENNEISDEGAKAIADSLKTNTVLTSLDLSYNKISDEGAKSLAESIKTNTVLTSLDLRRNEISEEGAKSIADSLKTNTVLTSLDLRTNKY